MLKDWWQADEVQEKEMIKIFFLNGYIVEVLSII